MNNPKITIITPSYNQGQFLEETILSVLDQGYPNLEYMIIDGGSTDNSVDVIKKYEKYLTYWESEKDSGQTHAINKGFLRSSGELVNWLNSDDLLEGAALRTLGDAVLDNPNADVFYGDYRAVNEVSSTIYFRKCSPYRPKCLFWGRQISSQPSVFFRRAMLSRHGMLNEQFHFCMDIEYWIRCARNDAQFLQLKCPIGVTRVHGDAKTTKLQRLLYDEHKSLVRSYGALSPLEKGSSLEDISYRLLNRYWRARAALNRVIYRGDFSLGRASKALSDLERSR